MAKIDVIRKEMMKSLKDGNKARKDALSALLTALKAKQIDKRDDLTEDEENTIILKEIKQMQETLESLPKDHTEMIEECNQRIQYYNEFAPKQMSDEEIRQCVNSVIKELELVNPTIKQKGIIMKNLMPLVKGKADGGLVNKIVGELFI